MPKTGTSVVDAGLLAPVRAGTPIEEVVSDQAWLQAMLDAEAGLSRAQARLGLIPPAVARVITETAWAERFDLVDLARRARGAANPVVALVHDLTVAVAAVDPAAADFVHRGSTSQDIMDTAAMLVADRSLRVMLSDLRRVAAALARLAAEYRDTPMPGRTLTQHAVPTTFGLKAAGWLHLVLDVEDRVQQVLHGGLPVQLGGAAGTLAGYLEHNRSSVDPVVFVRDLLAAFAAELGLCEPVLPWHTTRTPIADLGATMAFLCGGLGKIAVDVQVLGRTEIAEVVEPAAVGRGVSSAMPHKRNPVLSTLIRSAALQVPLLAAGLAQSLLAEDERPAGVWHAEWQPLRECLRLAGGAAHTAAELTEGLVPSPERMRANLELTGSLIVSERVAVALVPLLGKHAATQVVARASSQAVRDGRPFAAVLAEAPELTGRFGREEVEALLEPTDYTGAAGPLVDRALHRYESSRA